MTRDEAIKKHAELRQYIGKTLNYKDVNYSLKVASVKIEPEGEKGNFNVYVLHEPVREFNYRLSSEEFDLKRLHR